MHTITHKASPFILAWVGAAVIDVNLTIGASEASNTCTPVPTRTIISTGGSILAEGVTLTGDEVWCVCMCMCMCVCVVCVGGGEEPCFMDI